MGDYPQQELRLNLLLATQKVAALSAAATADEIGLSFSAALRIMVITSFNPLVGSFTITCVGSHTGPSIFSCARERERVLSCSHMQKEFRVLAAGLDFLPSWYA